VHHSYKRVDTGLGVVELPGRVVNLSHAELFFAMQNLDRLFISTGRLALKNGLLNLAFLSDFNSLNLPEVEYCGRCILPLLKYVCFDLGSLIQF
jgi:hypothetical protein